MRWVRLTPSLGSDATRCMTLKYTQARERAAPAQPLMGAEGTKEEAAFRSQLQEFMCEGMELGFFTDNLFSFNGPGLGLGYGGGVRTASAVDRTP